MAIRSKVPWPIGATVGVVVVTVVATMSVGALARTAPAPAQVRPLSAMTTMSMGSAPQSPKAQRFHDAMRQLWEDHIVWTRMFIVSFAAGLPDLTPTTDRLLQNQVDIGDAIAPFYGQAKAHRLTALLTTHILTAADLLTAVTEGDATAIQEAHDAWYANAREIARFLHRLNPRNWPLDDLREMMKDHLDLTLAEAGDRLNGDYAKDISDFDAVQVEILKMADMLSSGIIRQFPAKFH